VKVYRLKTPGSFQAASRREKGGFPSFPELLARISQLEEQCNAIARSLA
jgi:hypothetical protein